MKQWVCKNCGHMNTPFWHMRGGAIQCLLGFLFIPFYFFYQIGISFGVGPGYIDREIMNKYWTYFPAYPVCGACGGKNLYPTSSAEGKEVLKRTSKVG
jgi:rubredoxin